MSILVLNDLSSLCLPIGSGRSNVATAELHMTMVAGVINAPVVYPADELRPHKFKLKQYRSPPIPSGSWCVQVSGRAEASQVAAGDSVKRIMSQANCLAGRRWVGGLFATNTVLLGGKGDLPGAVTGFADHTRIRVTNLWLRMTVTMPTRKEITAIIEAAEYAND